MRIATLGPEGTCSEDVSNAYIRPLEERSSGDNEIVLCSDYFEAIDLLLADQVDVAAVAGAFIDFHEIVFRHIGEIYINEAVLSSQEFVLAHLSDRRPPSGEPPRVAVHPSPRPLLRTLDFRHTSIEARSNSDAARRVVAQEAEYCICNRRALDQVNREHAPAKPLSVVSSFGTINMVWAMFRKVTGAEDVLRAGAPISRACARHPLLQGALGATWSGGLIG